MSKDLLPISMEGNLFKALFDDCIKMLSEDTGIVPLRQLKELRRAIIE